MTTLIAAEPDDLRALLPWAMILAQAANSDLTIVLAQRKKGPTRLVPLPNEPAEDEADLVTLCRSLLSQPVSTLDDADSPEEADSCEVRLFQLVGDDWTVDLISQLEEIEPAAIVAAAPVISKDHSSSSDWQTDLLAFEACEILLIQDDTKSFEDELRVAVVVRSGSDNERVLQRAAELMAMSSRVKSTAVYVQPNVGDLSVSVGMRQLGHLLRGSLNRYECDQFERRVVVSGNSSDAVRKLDANDFDLILTETSHVPAMGKFFAARPAGEESDAIPAQAVLRPAESLGDRLWNRLDRWIRSVVPQLDRDERVDLVSRIHTSSQWDFDFVFLVSLATLIACLGLAEDSGAVIVGAMLVAPLMTPIAGVGLGVAHGNSFLTHVALRTALRGFATALLIGVLFGLAVQMASWTGWLESLRSVHEAKSLFPVEMENRTRPQFYDLLIALVSGMAAAYAMGRPNLFAALPGVAIAAALVPPVATCGIALSHGDLVKGGGALLLFVTNMVTIILGTTLIFRAVGIRTQKEGQQPARWTRYSLLLLVFLSILVTVLIEVVRAMK